MRGIYHVTEKRKEKEHRGQGIGVDYKPWIYVREVKSEGTSSEPVDWITGRTYQLLSQGEKYLWYYLRWNDDVLNIYEQYPLDLDKTNAIALASDIKPMQNGKQHMTTDFYVQYTDNHYEAFSVKDSPDALLDERRLELQFIEMQYWEQNGVPWHIVYKTDMNSIYVQNIELVTTFYNPMDVYDIQSYVKYLIAHKVLKTDLKHMIINPVQLYLDNKEQINEELSRDESNNIICISRDEHTG